MAAVTPAQICNLALLKVGEKQMIDALGDESEEAQICNVLYEPSRDAVLEEYWWPFATRHAILAVLEDHTATAPTTRKVYAYIYGLPTDCLMPRYIDVGIANPAPDQQAPMQEEDDATNGRVLLTDQKDAELVYTRKVIETGKFTPLFVEALSWKLAYELTMAIPVKSSLGLKMAEGYQFAVAKAAASAFKHSTPPAPARPAAIRAR